MKNLFFLLLLLGLLIARPATAQFLWQRSVGTATNDETAEFMIAVPGGFVTLGKSDNQTTYPPQALYLSKVDYDGTLLWTRRQALPNVNVLYPRGLFADASGNLVVSVITVAPAPPSLPPPFTQGRLIKFNSQGDTLWSRRVSSPASDAFLGVPVLGNDGNYVVIGQLATSLPALFKFSPTGALLWTQIVPYSTTRQGSLQNLVAVPGGYLAVSTPGAGLRSKYITVNELGIYQFERFGYVNPPASLVLDSQTNILAIGGSITKLSVQGDSIWSHAYQQFGQLLGLGRLVELPNGHYLAAGIRYNATDNDVGLLLTDHNGTRLRDTLLVRYQSNENAAGLALTPAGHYVMALGSTQGPIGGADQALFAYRNWSRLLPTRPQQPPAPAALAAYPNPATDHVRLLGPDGAAPAGNWVLLDMLGRLVQQGSCAGRPDDGLSLAQQPPGLYLLRLTDPRTGTTHTLRLQKH